MDFYAKEKAETQQHHQKVIEDLMAQHVQVTSLWAQEQSRQMEDLRRTISNELTGVHNHEKEVLKMKLMMAAHVRCLLSFRSGWRERVDGESFVCGWSERGGHRAEV